ncbi:MAG: methylated-DNA--[protein]-cysteine S-methyltransferase [Chloroflexota bacterium]|nr:methylated-DNA--[protein]-cysteine S-methyltransferase [Chloroflexota bacterium]
MNTPAYVHVPSPFGDLSVVWQAANKGVAVTRILLPNEQPLVEGITRATPLDTSLPPEIAELSERMERFLAGKVIEFEQRHLDLLALESCPDFQRRVLLAEHGIPRGWVSTYGRIARHLGLPGGARAVGNALARNPFPIVIPCHRAIRADGRLGGFRGGIEMKRALLEMEGIETSPAGKALTDQFCY